MAITTSRKPASDERQQLDKLIFVGTSLSPFSFLPSKRTDLGQVVNLCKQIRPLVQEAAFVCLSSSASPWIIFTAGRQDFHPHSHTILRSTVKWFLLLRQTSEKLLDADKRYLSPTEKQIFTGFSTANIIVIHCLRVQFTSVNKFTPNALDYTHKSEHFHPDFSDCERILRRYFSSGEKFPSDINISTYAKTSPQWLRSWIRYVHDCDLCSTRLEIFSWFTKRAYS